MIAGALARAVEYLPWTGITILTALLATIPKREPTHDTGSFPIAEIVDHGLKAIFATAVRYWDVSSSIFHSRGAGCTWMKPL